MHLPVSHARIDLDNRPAGDWTLEIDSIYAAAHRVWPTVDTRVDLEEGWDLVWDEALAALAGKAEAYCARRRYARAFAVELTSVLAATDPSGRLVA